jgi:hypothetical protein
MKKWGPSYKGRVDKEVLTIFKKEKSMGLRWLDNGVLPWIFYLLVDEILRVVEESRISWKIIFGALNATFTTLIPKKLNPSSFGDFKPILLCNLLYKVIVKLIANMIKGVISS